MIKPAVTRPLNPVAAGRRWTIRVAGAGSRPVRLGAQGGGQAASPVGSTGYSDRQAFSPPWSASAC